MPRVSSCDVDVCIVNLGGMDLIHLFQKCLFIENSKLNVKCVALII